MARTKASVAAKVMSGKSSKAQKSNVQQSSNTGKQKALGSSKHSWSGGNPYYPREIPNWQLPITRFFPGFQIQTRDQSSSKINDFVVEESNTDNIVDIENNDLNLTEICNSELPPLIDDPTSHKIGEYFHSYRSFKSHDDNPKEIKSIKNKGKGKSSVNHDKKSVEKSLSGKENVTPNLSNPSTVLNCAYKRTIGEIDNESAERDSLKRIKIRET